MFHLYWKYFLWNNFVIFGSDVPRETIWVEFLYTEKGTNDCKFGKRNFHLGFMRMFQIKMFLT
jgi:hypothetical protein